MIKILQVFGSLGMGGAESRMVDVLHHLGKSKYTFDFLTLDRKEQHYREDILKNGSRIIELDNPRDCGFLKHIVSLIKVIKDGKYDAVHSHTAHHSGLVMFAAWIARVPVRISHSRNTNSKKNKALFYKLYLNAGRVLIKLFSTKKLAISNDAGKFLFGKSQFVWVPNAIDLTKYLSYDSDYNNKIKEQFDIPKEAFVIGQIGRFEVMKNHEFTLKWFLEYRKTHSDSYLVLVGDGALKNDMEVLAQKLGISQWVVFTGIRDDVPQFIHIFDVLIFPSIYEGLGGVSLEAQAAGIPVVQADTIPEETDVGLRLIKVLSLNDEYDVWSENIDNCRGYNVPDEDRIKEAFLKMGYDICAVTEKYCSIYSRKN